MRSQTQYLCFRAQDKHRKESQQTNMKQVKFDPTALDFVLSKTVNPYLTCKLRYCLHLFSVDVVKGNITEFSIS